MNLWTRNLPRKLVILGAVIIALALAACGGTGLDNIAEKLGGKTVTTF
jgi:hypothetical protein